MRLRVFPNWVSRAPRSIKGLVSRGFPSQSSNLAFPSHGFRCQSVNRTFPSCHLLRSFADPYVRGSPFPMPMGEPDLPELVFPVGKGISHGCGSSLAISWCDFGSIQGVKRGVETHCTLAGVAPFGGKCDLRELGRGICRRIGRSRLISYYDSH